MIPAASFDALILGLHELDDLERLPPLEHRCFTWLATLVVGYYFRSRSTTACSVSAVAGPGPCQRRTVRLDALRTFLQKTLSSHFSTVLSQPCAGSATPSLSLSRPSAHTSAQYGFYGPFECFQPSVEVARRVSFSGKQHLTTCQNGYPDQEAHFFARGTKNASVPRSSSSVRKVAECWRGRERRLWPVSFGDWQDSENAICEQLAIRGIVVVRLSCKDDADAPNPAGRGVQAARPVPRRLSSEVS